MLINLVTIISTLLFLKGTESTLLEPVRRCVPTALVRGPCHICVCSSEGVYHCRQQQCQIENLDTNRTAKDCEPNYTYRENNTFCTCSNDGYWNSEECQEKFKYLQPKIPLTHQKFRSSIPCMANVLYLIDCNVCRCATSGVIDITLCTNRYCGKRHKADNCTYGDILRLDHEVCSCSDINFYIDRLCTGVLDRGVQTLQTDNVLQLVDIGRSWKSLRELETGNCDIDVVYSLDCNKCMCIYGYLNCNRGECIQEKKSYLRHENPMEKESLPELKSAGDSCDPGKKYRFKCNTCLCSVDGTSSCTTMICLEDFVLDIKALRGALSNS